MGANLKRLHRCIISLVMVALMMIPSLAGFGGLTVTAEETDYTQFVNPFVGTAVDNGQLFPGSVVPYGLVKLSPDTYPHRTDDHAGYDWNKLQIQGFSHTRIEGVGGQGAGGDVLVTPSYTNYTKRPTDAERAMTYSHDNEEASPGYYSVDLRAKNASGVDTGTMGYIKAEMTSDIRTGYHRYTFPKQGQANISVDLNYTYHGTDVRNATLSVKQEATATALSGRFSGKNVSGHGLYTMYFYMETSKPASSVKTWNGQTLGTDNILNGNDLGAVLNFDVNDGEVIETKVSISPVSAEQAKIDMYKEAPWETETFQSIKERAKGKWNEILGKVDVKSSTKSDPTGELKKLFYTHLYHMFTTPVNATSTSNTFMATDTNVYKAEDYTHYDSWTLWDDFRKYPMIGLVYPEAYKDIIRSLANTMNYGIGTWGISTQSVPTVRTEHAVALLADGIAKGFDDIDNLVPAYEKAKEIANATVTSSVESRGYISNRVDRTVEFSYDDWAISILADYFDNTADRNKYLARSFYYKNLYKDDAVKVNSGQPDEYTMGLLWPRNDSGTFLNTNPEQYGANSLYQGTIWQYTWWDSNDVKGLMDLMGGPERTLKGLSYLYGEQDPNNGSRMLHTNTNEIDLHTPYLFNFAGKPSRTQYWVRQIHTKETWNRYSGTGEYNPPRYEKVFRLAPDGFMETMDDDAGTMSSMYVAAAMGLFPMTPGDTTFQIGSPFFEEVSLDVGGGRKFVIKANNVSPDNFYIQSGKLNGTNHNRTWVDYSEIIRGGVLEFEMGANPSTWAEDGVLAKSSSETVDTAIFDKTDNLSYSTSIFAESDVNDGSVGSSIAVKARNGKTFAVTANEDLISSGKVTVMNVPAGLTAKAAAISTTEIKISLEGKAAKHNLSDSIGNLSVKLNTTLFTAETDSKYLDRKDIKIMFDDYRIDFDKLYVKEAAANNGTIFETVDVTLSGGAAFNATAGQDLIAANKAEILGLPAGLNAKITVDSDSKATISFIGATADHRLDIDDVIVNFNDSAFSGDISAASVNNSSFGGMQSMILDFFEPLENELQNIINDAKALKESKYVKYTYGLLKDAITEGEALIAGGTATQEQYQASCDKINNLIFKLVRRDDGFDRFEGENSDSWSDGGLKNESINLGGVIDGSWVAYKDRSFGKTGVKSISIRYDNNTNRCAPDAKLEVRTGSSTGPLIATIDLPQTKANGWGTYAVVTADLPAGSNITGIQDIYVVFKGTTGGTAPTGGKQEFICNFDYIEFEAVPTYGRFEGENRDVWSAGNLKVETTNNITSPVDSIGTSVVNLGATYNGAWLGFYNVKFTGEGLKEIKAHYSTSNSGCPVNGSLEIRKDSPTGELIGTMTTRRTGGWAYYDITSFELEESLIGVYDIFMVMIGEDGFSYVCNFDYLELSNGKAPEPEAKSAYDRLEAEARDSWSAGNLKTEGGASGTVLAATYNGAWIKYDNLNFGETGPSQIMIHYVNNSGRCAPDAVFELRKGDQNGELIKTLPIPATANNWNDYKKVYFDLSDVADKLKGKNDITFVMKGTTTTNPYICNLDYLQFTDNDGSYGRLEAEARTSWSGGELKTESGGTGINIGATYDGAWLAFEKVNLSNKGLTEIEVNYSKNSGRCAADSRFEIRVGSPSGQLLTTIEMPATANNWNTYKTTSAKLNTPYVGIEDLYVVMRGTTTTSLPFIANIDYFTLITEVEEEEEYGIPVFKVADKEITRLSEAAGKKLDASIKIKPSEAKNILVITALYDANGRLIETKNAKKSFTANESAVMNVSIDVPQSVTDFSYKLFVWDYGTLKPLKAATEIK